ncbi:MAG TPA: OmpA family protein [Kofleriaceae bacterium]|jgi:outer membrane protein OmpA-like peptidoglycan-associated protein|nr:OmpA family protein [Kofleriaceae bacterium]
MLKSALVVAWIGVCGVAGSGLVGCHHAKSRVIVAETQITVLDPILFATGSDQLPANAQDMIAAIAKTIDAHPEFLKLAVEAHTVPEDAANDADRTALGQRRAQAVLAGIVAHGIAADRLEPTTATDGPARIEIVIEKRAPGSE